ncbi:MAG: Na/Pi cotransporter family protein [Lachnospiraceae bacterium]|nr:Na/Pi cotransporter family protein [Oscillospiraceae bacterium]MDY5647667.1 Na/Pi cotransporter family protein [Lachnospiraceae bacterium]
MDIGIVLSMIGGLGLFLYGMKLMSDGLEKAAGAKLRGILEFFTKNRLMGTLVGIVFCAIIQSSSATTVMVVSFVNSGLMNLYQAVGVIMGANIGTTVTSQLVAFNLSEIAPLFLMAGVIMVMFCKKPVVTKIGEVILGFGVLFMGLSIMSSSMSTLKDSPLIVNALSTLSNRFLAVFVGFLLTAIIQSSSVTVSILLLMAQQGLLELGICFYVILGCNIGACTSALLASLSGKKDAKRAAMIHFLFNVFGTILMVVILSAAGDWVEALIVGISGGNVGRCVANAHTLFKVFQVIVLFPFAGWIVKATYLVVPGDDRKDSREGYELAYIGSKNIFSPATAVVEVTKELERMADMAAQNLNRGMNCLITLDEEDIAEVYRVEKYVDYLNHAITDYLVKINQMTIPVDDAKSIGGLFHVVNDIERIGDHAENMADAAKMRMEDNVSFSKQAQREMGEMLDMVLTILSYSIDMFSHNNREHLEEILELENNIDDMEKKLQQSHVERLTRNECTPEAGMIFSDIVSGLERVADHATNIAFSILDEDPE